MNSIRLQKRLLGPLCAFAFMGFAATAVSDDWSQFGGPTRNFSVSKESLNPSPAANAWRTNIAGGDASIVIREERMVVSAIDFAPDGTDAHRITCLDHFSGKLLWEHVYAENSFVSQDISDGYPVRPVSTPAIVGERVIACGFGGSVRCLDLKTGSQYWAIDLVKDYGAKPIQYGFACSPWCDLNQVIIACGGEQALLISLNLANGTLNWKCGSGAASYTSPILMSVAEPNSTETSTHLVYAAGDAAIGVDSNSGKILWQYSYPQPGLTNAVTPIAVAKNKLLFGGQGVQGCRLLSIEKTAFGYSVAETWHNSRITPFYCNWIQLQNNSKCVVGFIGKTLTALDWTTGVIYWQKRDWTDCNLLSLGDQVLAVRGDGFIGLLNADENGFELVASDDTVKDRIWAPPTFVDQQLYLIGRNQLHRFPMDQLKKSNGIPSGTEVTSMEAMYGNRPERIQKLIELTKGVGKFPFEEYLAVASDRSLQLGEGDYKALIENLAKRDASKVAFEIASDWAQRFPQSIPAWQQFIDFLRKSGKSDQADLEERERMVEVTVELTAPQTQPMPEHIFMTGNAASLGPWKPDALELQPTGGGKYKATCLLPRGDFQFKFSCGTSESFEVRSDGRNTSNRRHRITGPTTLTATVQAWKK